MFLLFVNPPGTNIPDEPNKVDPLNYVVWCLGGPQVSYPPVFPEPNQLLEFRRMDRYKSNRPTVLKCVELQFTMEFRTLRNQMPAERRTIATMPEDRLLALLYDSDQRRLSPLFCYLLALQRKTEKVLLVGSGFEEDAMFQFARQPDECTAVYGASNLPEDFAAKSARFYARLVGKYAAEVARRGRR